MECIVDTCLCGLLFYAFGFAFMFGHGNGFIGQGALTWNTERIDLTTKPGDKEAVGLFRFENNSQKTVTITSVQPSCGCTTAALEKRIYAPGEKGEIKAVFTLGDRVGHKRMFVIGLAVFGMASLVAAYAPSPLLLIGGRALLAVGAAMMMPATLSIIRLTFSDERERAMAIGLWGAVASGGAAVGPLIGGVLLEYFWWGSVFLINVPVAVAALVAALAFIPRSEGRSDVGWDLPGSLLILVGLVGLAFAIKEVAMEAPSLPAAASAAAIGALALGWFARRQRGSAAPLIDFSLFDNRGFRVAVVAALVSAFSVIGLALV